MDHTDYYIRLFVDWIPFLIFLGILVYFMKKGIGGKQAQFMESARQYQSEHLEETRKINANLERIAAALEKPER
jgi:ATP-dependent Zn protease